MESGISPPADTGAAAADPVSPSLRRLLDETADLIDSPTAHAVMNQMLNAAFSFLLDAKLMENAFKPKATALPPVQTPDDESDAMQLSQTREEIDNAATTKFASVLAVLARQAHLIGNGVPNEYLQVGSPIFFPSLFFSSLQSHFSRSLASSRGWGNMCGAAVGGNVLSC